MYALEVALRVMLVLQSAVADIEFHVSVDGKDVTQEFWPNLTTGKTSAETPIVTRPEGASVRSVIKELRKRRDASAEKEQSMGEKKCLLRKQKAEARQAVRGYHRGSIDLSCDFCDDGKSDLLKPMLWYKIEAKEKNGKFAVKEVELSLMDNFAYDRITVSADHTLTIRKLRWSDAAIYFCANTDDMVADYVTEANYTSVIKDSVKYLYHLDVNVLENSFFSKVSQTGTAYPKPRGPRRIESENLLMHTLWQKWSECGVCGKAGERRRIGACMIRKLDKSQPVNSWQLEELLRFYPAGIPCRTGLMRHVYKLAVALDEMELEPCYRPCDKPSEGETMLVDLVQTGNVKSALEEPPNVLKRTLRRHVGQRLTFVCPGVELDSAVSWEHNGEPITTLSLGRQYHERRELLYDPNRVLVDLMYTLRISHVMQSDEGLISCWSGGRKIADITLIVETDPILPVMGVWEGCTFLLMSFVVDFIIFLTILVIRHRSRPKQLNKELMKKWSPKMEDSDSESNSDFDSDTSSSEDSESEVEVITVSSETNLLPPEKKASAEKRPPKPPKPPKSGPKKNIKLADSDSFVSSSESTEVSSSTDEPAKPPTPPPLARIESREAKPPVSLLDSSSIGSLNLSGVSSSPAPSSLSEPLIPLPKPKKDSKQSSSSSSSASTSGFSSGSKQDRSSVSSSILSSETSINRPTASKKVSQISNKIVSSGSSSDSRQIVPSNKSTSSSSVSRESYRGNPTEKLPESAQSSSSNPSPALSLITTPVPSQTKQDSFTSSTRTSVSPGSPNRSILSSEESSSSEVVSSTSSDVSKTQEKSLSKEKLVIESSKSKSSDPDQPSTEPNNIPNREYSSGSVSESFSGGGSESCSLSDESPDDRKSPFNIFRRKSKAKPALPKTESIQPPGLVPVKLPQTDQASKDSVLPKPGSPGKSTEPKKTTPSKSPSKKQETTTKVNVQDATKEKKPQAVSKEAVKKEKTAKSSPKTKPDVQTTEPKAENDSKESSPVSAGIKNLIKKVTPKPKQDSPTTDTKKSPINQISDGETEKDKKQSRKLKDFIPFSFPSVEKKFPEPDFVKSFKSKFKSSVDKESSVEEGTQKAKTTETDNPEQKQSPKLKDYIPFDLPSVPKKVPVPAFVKSFKSHFRTSSDKNASVEEGQEAESTSASKHSPKLKDYLPFSLPSMDRKIPVPGFAKSFKSKFTSALEKDSSEDGSHTRPVPFQPMPTQTRITNRRHFPSQFLPLQEPDFYYDYETPTVRFKENVLDDTVFHSASSIPLPDSQSPEKNATINSDSKTSDVSSFRSALSLTFEERGLKCAPRAPGIYLDESPYQSSTSLSFQERRH